MTRISTSNMAAHIRKVIVMSLALAVLVFGSMATAYADGPSARQASVFKEAHEARHAPSGFVGDWVDAGMPND